MEIKSYLQGLIVIIQKVRVMDWIYKTQTLLIQIMKLVVNSTKISTIQLIAFISWGTK